MHERHSRRVCLHSIPRASLDENYSYLILSLHNVSQDHTAHECLICISKRCFVARCCDENECYSVHLSLTPTKLFIQQYQLDSWLYRRNLTPVWVVGSIRLDTVHLNKWINRIDAYISPWIIVGIVCRSTLAKPGYIGPWQQSFWTLAVIAVISESSAEFLPRETSPSFFWTSSVCNSQSWQCWSREVKSIPNFYVIGTRKL